MLSKLSRLIMGLLWKKPMNPYELTKLMDMAVIQDWFPLTAQSIYTTIRNLEKNGYLSGETTREGKLPPKTIYSLTGEGERVLLSELPEGLKSYETAASDFGIALFHIGALNKEEALELTGQRIDLLDSLLDKARGRLEMNRSKIPFNMRMMLTCNLYRLEAEQKATRELLEEIKNASDWETSFTRFM
jgi:DNA-binding PadR family transcriptional regulator